MIWVPKHLIESIRIHEPSYSGLQFRDQFAIAWMVLQFATGKYRHKSDPDSIYLSERMIKELWKYPKRMREIIGSNYFWVLAGSNFIGKANSWRLRANMSLALHQSLLYRGKTKLVDQNGKNVTLKGNGVLSKWRVSGEAGRVCNSKWSAHPSALIQVNLEALEAYIASLMALANAEKKNQTETSDWAHRQLRESRYILLLSRLRSDGLIPMSYEQCSTGRIFDSLHIQGLNRSLRKVVFTGMYDYDIANCHFTLMHQIVGKQGIALPHIKYYLQNKSLVRNLLAKDLGASIDMVKDALIALAFGAKLSGYSETALCKIFQADTAPLFIKHPLVKNLYKDIQIASRVIIKGAKNPKGRIVNELGLAYGKKGGSRSSQLAHILQGVEASILHAVIKRLGDSVVLAMHDGWICKEDRDVKELEEWIWLDTGYAVQLQKERLVASDLQNETRANDSTHINHGVDVNLESIFTSSKAEEMREDDTREGQPEPINPPALSKGAFIITGRPHWNCEKGVQGVKRSKRSW